MEYVYAALVLHATGKGVTEEGVTNVLNAAGATVNDARAKALIAALEGINIDDAISKAVFTAPAVAAPTAPAPKEEKEEAKVEEEKEKEKEKEEEEETGMEGLGALFG